MVGELLGVVESSVPVVSSDYGRFIVKLLSMLTFSSVLVSIVHKMLIA